MNIFSAFAKEDYLMLKWQITLSVLSVMLAAGIYLGIDYLNDQSSRDMRSAQAGLSTARSRVDLIAEEEATIIEYIGRYQELASDGVVEDEDRLQMLENITEIRADNNLWPVTLNIQEQKSFLLPYSPDVTDPGGPIHLRSSVIELGLPLLHEEDLNRLIRGLMDRPGLFQPTACEIVSRNANSRNFIVLSQNFNASCQVIWYTFDLDPPQDNPYGY